MKKYKFLTLLFCVAAIQFVSAQEVLPRITVKDFNGKIIVSWQNAYNVPVTNISIQRSFDSTKNFSTIGSVLNPQNLENGFADDKPPYNKMYYRVFISFEGGSYVFSSTVRPVREVPFRKETVITHTYNPDPEENENTGADSSNTKKTDPNENKNNKANDKNVPVVTPFPWQVSAITDSIAKAAAKKDPSAVTITYPSQRIYTSKENNLVIYLPDAALKKYSVKFYDESDDFLFELTKLKEEYLIVEKVNFVHSGWFHFELFENTRLIEKNKFFIGKDGKNSNTESYKKGGN